MATAVDVESGLLARIRVGDRRAAAEFLEMNEPLIRRRFRHKLGAALRRLVDSEELLSTLRRRLDAYVAAGRLAAATPQELWALVQRIGEHSVADKLRVLRRLRDAEREDGPVASALYERLEDSDGNAPRFERNVEDILGLITSEVDREIVRLWMCGLEHRVIAHDLGMTTEAVRKRWQRVKIELRSRLAPA
jgi:DNA-directed RNA polymerase specialized sigma24 family protein